MIFLELVFGWLLLLWLWCLLWCDCLFFEVCFVFVEGCLWLFLFVGLVLLCFLVCRCICCIF